MKNKFEIKNLLGNSQKRTYRREIWRQQLAGATRLLIVLLLAFLFFFGDELVNRKKGTPEAFKQTIDVKAVEVTEKKDPHDLEPLEYIRIRGQELGFDDYTISRFIRVARCESNLRPDAKNGSSTATGIFQIIIGTWDSNKCTGERWDFVDNVNCGYKLLKDRGFQPWESSKNCWNE